MMDNTSTNDQKLIRRARALRNRYAARDQDVAAALDQLSEVGRVALIGGALRELHFNPPGCFSSDLDFVIQVEDDSSFRRLISQFKAKRNNFGGYGIKFRSGISIDFWNAVDTWASVKGYRHVSRLEHIVDTTFFNVDAILYVLGENQVVAKDGTREALSERFLDINLLPNPNPVGAAVRAIRRLIDHRMTASETLLRFIAEQVDTVGWHHLASLDAKAYPHKPTLHHFCKHEILTGEGLLEQAYANECRLVSEQQLEFNF